MEVIKDKVVDFSSASKTSKAGKPYTVHTCVLEVFGPVSLGFTKPETLAFGKNDMVAMEVDKKFGEWQYQRTVDLGEEATLSTPPAAAPKAAWGGGGGGKFVPKVFPVPADHGDMAIIHQNSLTNALKFYELSDHVPTSEEVIKQAYVFADFSSGAHLAKLAKD
jgi:hypothetical protein